jgi:hypothetical protein
MFPRTFTVIRSGKITCHPASQQVTVPCVYYVVWINYGRHGHPDMTFAVVQPAPVETQIKQRKQAYPDKTNS